jgi:NCS1 family nucleobase:cation symporter-1
MDNRGQAIYTMLGVAIRDWEPPFALPLSFIVFWMANMYVVVRGSDAIKWLETGAAPFLILSGLALLAWAIARAGGLGPVLDHLSRVPPVDSPSDSALPEVTA